MLDDGVIESEFLDEKLKNEVFAVGDKVGTVLINPPFGTKSGNKGIDVAFLKAALSLKPDAVYSIHKSSTREFLISKIGKLGEATGESYDVVVLAKMKYDLKATYRMFGEEKVELGE